MLIVVNLYILNFDLMKKIVLSGIIVICGLFIIDVLVGVVGDYLINHFSDAPCDEETTILSYCLNGSDEDIVIIGASSARNAVIPQLLQDYLKNKTGRSFSVFNSSASGGTIAYKYATTMNLCDRNKTKVILLDLWSQDLHKSDDSGLGVLRPFCHSNAYAAECLYSNTSRLDKLLLQSNIYCWKATLVKYLVQLINRRKTDGYYPNYGVFLNYIDRRNEPDVNIGVDSNSKAELEKLLNCAKAHDVKVIAINFPRYYQLNKTCVEYTELNNILRENEIPYIDIWSMEVFNDSSLFYDERHLNDNGARICTNIIAGEISQYL